MVTPVLVTLAQLQAHLRLPLSGSPLSDADRDLQYKLDAATASVVRYISRPAIESTIEAWTPPGTAPIGSPSTDAPIDVCQAILVVAGDLYRDRGDEGADAQTRDTGMYAPLVVTLLKTWRDPVVA